LFEISFEAYTVSLGLGGRVAAEFARFGLFKLFFWDYLKAQVHQHRPQTLKALEEAITKEAAAIPPEMTRRVMEKYREILNKNILSCMVWFLLASQIGEFFLPHPA
jgi:hypothetical protein